VGLKERSYYATRILLQNGFKAINITGGMLSRTQASFFERVDVSARHASSGDGRLT